MNRQEMEQLLARAMDAEADPGERAQLAAVLKENPEWIEWARGQMMIHGALGVLMEDEVSRERRVKSQMAAIAESDEIHFAAEVRSRLAGRRRWKVMMSVAAVMVLFLTAGFLLMRSAAPSSGGAAVATVQRAENVEWEGAESRNLRAGDTLRISRGLLELDLAGKGRLIVEGPASLDFPNDGTAVLHQGRVVMKATKLGVGYRIETPEGALIDLGTEFGVMVGKDGGVETQVLDGHVEARPKGGARMMLAQDDAVRMDADGGTKILAKTGQFYTELPPLPKARPDYIHWSFDEGTGDVAAADGVLANGVADAGRMRLFGSPDRWKSGPVRSSVDFDGKGGFGETHYRGIGEGNPRSVCFWLRVPKDFVPKQAYGIISWGRPREKGETWQISANPLSEDGPLGRIRLGLFGGQVVGSTDLRDGEWHHIAVVLYGGSRPNVGTHILMYVDGRLEELTSRALQEVHTAADAAEHGVWIGRNVWFSKTKETAPPQRYFRGGMDELYIFSGALNAEEVRNLMKNSPPGKGLVPHGDSSR